MHRPDSPFAGDQMTATNGNDGSVSKRPTRASLKVMVLAGGPDRERSVSLQSGAAVAHALRQAGHDVSGVLDIGPDDMSALDHWERWCGDVVFPVLHGPWGEGGPLQRILSQRQIAYVGCGPEAASLCMDKYRTKLALVQHGLPTPRFERIGGQSAEPDAAAGAQGHVRGQQH